jgi:hypothetical protein
VERGEGSRVVCRSTRRAPTRRRGQGARVVGHARKKAFAPGQVGDSALRERTAACGSSRTSSRPTSVGPRPGRGTRGTASWMRAACSTGARCGSGRPPSPATPSAAAPAGSTAAPSTRSSSGCAEHGVVSEPSPPAHLAAYRRWLDVFPAHAAVRSQLDPAVAPRPPGFSSLLVLEEPFEDVGGDLGGEHKSAVGASHRRSVRPCSRGALRHPPRSSLCGLRTWARGRPCCATSATTRPGRSLPASSPCATRSTAGYPRPIEATAVRDGVVPQLKAGLQAAKDAGKAATTKDVRRSLRR